MLLQRMIGQQKEAIASRLAWRHQREQKKAED